MQRNDAAKVDASLAEPERAKLSRDVADIVGNASANVGAQAYDPLLKPVE